MDTPDDSGANHTRPWRAMAAGAAVVAAVAATSSFGWWDASGARDEPRPDVQVVGTVPAGRAMPDPPIAAESSCDPTAPVTSVAGGDGGAPNPWAAGDEAVRRWLAERQGTPGIG